MYIAHQFGEVGDDDKNRRWFGYQIRFDVVMNLVMDLVIKMSLFHNYE